MLMIQITAAPLFEEISGFDNVNKIMNHLEIGFHLFIWNWL